VPGYNQNRGQGPLTGQGSELGCRIAWPGASPGAGRAGHCGAPVTPGPRGEAWRAPGPARCSACRPPARRRLGGLYGKPPCCARPRQPRLARRGRERMRGALCRRGRAAARRAPAGFAPAGFTPRAFQNVMGPGCWLGDLECWVWRGRGAGGAGPQPLPLTRPGAGRRCAPAVPARARGGAGRLQRPPPLCGAARRPSPGAARRPPPWPAARASP
jgi:hypothetical protein